MIILTGAITGAIIGAVLARKRKGKLADILLYSFVFALMFTLAGLFFTLLIHRAAL